MFRNGSDFSDPFHVPAWMDALSGAIGAMPRVCTGLGNLESRVLAERLDPISIRKPIFVAGLARAGSTILLELLSQHPEVATHRYRDFPAVHLPHWWNWFVDRAARGPMRASERAHLDGIRVTRESPEAFEEVLWMTFFPGLHDPGKSAVLTAETLNLDFEGFYVDHIRKLLLLRARRRYLTKGNYNVSRLGYLLNIFPDARFVVPIRHPVWHIASLMKQHRIFRDAGSADPRVTRHLRRAGHFEFGLDRRPINFGDDEATARVVEHWRKGEEVQGWAEYWRQVYDHVADTLAADERLAKAVLVVRYEDLCRTPEATMREILDHCDLPPGRLPGRAKRVVRHPTYYRPQFGRADLARIGERTATTLDRYGYLTNEIAL